jgi:hypothetical protein
MVERTFTKLEQINGNQSQFVLKISEPIENVITCTREGIEKMRENLIKKIAECDVILAEMTKVGL